MASAVWKEFDELLINSVRDYPCLYNCKLKEFKDNRIKENAWKKVAAELDSSGNFIYFIVVQMRTVGLCRFTK